MNGLLSALIFLSYMVLPGTAGADAVDDQWRIAQRYYRAGDWSGAEREFLRHGVLYAGDARCADGVRLRALSLWQDDAPVDAIRLLSNVVDNNGVSDPAAGRLLAVMLMERGYYRVAAYRLRQLAGADVPSADIRFLQGWNELLNMRMHAAQVHFASITDGPYARQAAALVPRLGGLTAEREKVPALAGWLSFLLPGAGQAYCGRWWEAAGSLGINALLGWWMYTMVEREHYWTAAGVYMFGGVRYHLGGAVQAFRKARAINRKHSEKRINELKREFGYAVPADSERIIP